MELILTNVSFINFKDLDVISESCKMEVLIKILERCELKKDKVLVFSKSIPTLGNIIISD